MSAETEALVQEIIAAHRDMDGAALPILHAVQEALGHVPESVIPVIAAALNVSRAEMHGVVTFYHDFRRVPAGRHVLKLCRAEACQSAGAHAVSDRIRQRLGIGFGETSGDGRVTLDAVYCLGLCATAPAAMLDGRVIGRLDAAAADHIVAEVSR
jgi:formate dehydrogenase subunit gamma